MLQVIGAANADLAGNQLGEACMAILEITVNPFGVGMIGGNVEGNQQTAIQTLRTPNRQCAVIGRVLLLLHPICQILSYCFPKPLCVTYTQFNYGGLYAVIGQCDLRLLK